MGRKIPAKKHRGVKDPLEQQARRRQRLQALSERPPRDPDEQPVPRSLLRLFAPPQPRRPQAPSAKSHAPAGGGGGASGVSGLRRLAGEPARAFSRRIGDAVRAMHTPASELSYHDLEADEAEDVRGQRMVALRERRARKRRRAGAGGPAQDEGAQKERPRRAQRRKLRIQEKRALAEESARASAASAPCYERVPFGDTARAPPALSAPRRAPPQQGARRGLLLAAALAPVPSGGAAPSPPGGAAPSPSERLRLAAVAAYRALRHGQRQPQRAT